MTTEGSEHVTLIRMPHAEDASGVWLRENHLLVLSVLERSVSTDARSFETFVNVRIIAFECTLKLDRDILLGA